jgi:hypothetical protein
MEDSAIKKRSRDDNIRGQNSARPTKKARKQKKQDYHSSDSEDDNGVEDDGTDFQAVNLIDSEEEIDVDNMPADEGDDTTSDSDPDELPGPTSTVEPAPKLQQMARDAPVGTDSDSDYDSEEYDDDEYDIEAGDDSTGQRQKTKSKRNDPTAFATSLSKILSTKLSTSRRADPVLARSADAQKVSREAQDAILESKARLRLREQKRLALEKGRVRDVLVATATTGAAGEGDGNTPTATTAQILEIERRLRKVAQRGVVRLFNAVRAAQVRALEAERTMRNEGVTGVKRREEKVTEMSRKGFLDLIASGGGALKKGPLEEA